jgi:hypothetical protein
MKVEGEAFSSGVMYYKCNVLMARLAVQNSGYTSKLMGKGADGKEKKNNEQDGSEKNKKKYQPVAKQRLNCVSCSKEFTGKYEDGTDFKIILRSDAIGRQFIDYDFNSVKSRGMKAVLDRKNVFAIAADIMIQGGFSPYVIPGTFTVDYYDALYLQWKYVYGY